MLNSNKKDYPLSVKSRIVLSSLLGKFGKLNLQPSLSYVNLPQYRHCFSHCSKFWSLQHPYGHMIRICALRNARALQVLPPSYLSLPRPILLLLLVTLHSVPQLTFSTFLFLLLTRHIWLNCWAAWTWLHEVKGGRECTFLLHPWPIGMGSQLMSKICLTARGDY